MTIFGFNTDVKHNDTIYHVQSEAHPGNSLVQTLVFVKGQCVGKRTVSYGREKSKPDFSDQNIHELLKAQHRTIVDAILAGTLESALAVSSDAEEAATSPLSLTWIKAEPATNKSSLNLYFQLTDGTEAASGAELLFRIGSAVDAPVIARAITDSVGQAQTEITITDELRRESTITVQATRGNKSTTRKFRFQKPE